MVDANADMLTPNTSRFTNDSVNTTMNTSGDAEGKHLDNSIKKKKKKKKKNPKTTVA